jgi:ubiquinone biosynthesis protein
MLFSSLKICFFSIKIFLRYKFSKKIISGKELSETLIKLGPSFVKFGQTLATRSDILGTEVAQSLLYLQDSLPAEKNINVKKLIEKDLNKKFEDLFLEISNKPIATASIAQVYKAKTLQGQEVAVKILKPNIRKKFESDIKTFKFFAKLFESISSEARRLSLCEIVDMFDNIIRLELDLENEAANASELSSRMQSEDYIIIPKVDWQRTSKNILTTHWHYGFKIYENDGYDKYKIDRTRLAKNFVNMFFNQIYKQGFFHADLHYGNMLIDKKGRIILIDFGIVGKLDRKTRYVGLQIMEGFINRNYDKVAKYHFESGYVPSNQSMQNFANACRIIGEKYIHNTDQESISPGKFLGFLFEITKNFNMRTRNELLLLQKSLVLAEAINMQISGKNDIWKLAKDWLQDNAQNNLGLDSLILYKIENIWEKFQILIQESSKKN